jgi:hypothetical protein
LNLQELHTLLNGHLEDIATMFRSPKITLIVRAPDLSDGDVVVTDDDLDAAIASLQRLKDRR